MDIFVCEFLLPMSRRRSPGRFHFQPSSCWCSVYCNLRSWNTTRTMLYKQTRTYGVKTEDVSLSRSQTLAVWQSSGCEEGLTFTILLLSSVNSPCFLLSNIRIS